MPLFTQADRPLAVTTPLGDDALLLEAVAGREAVSELFEFELALLAEPDTEVAFEAVLGRPAAVVLRADDQPDRHLHGIVCRFSQGGEVRGPDGTVTFVRYRATLVPTLWLLTRRVRSRIFQQQSVPDILKAVLALPDVTFDLAAGYPSRDYCVQYRESDFAFASRLMEEEGIAYHFRHTEDAHELVVTDHRGGHAEMPSPAEVTYEAVTGGNRPTDRVYTWEKTQQIRSGAVVLWDHSFEAAHNNLEGRATIQASATVGTVKHPLTAGGSDKLEVYDFPGEYAKRFDGVGPGGEDRPADVDKLFTENDRATRLRMEQEAAQAVAADGTSDCRRLTAGHTFALARHFNADGEYLLTAVEHEASAGGAYVGGSAEARYENRFRCLPADLPLRPERLTPRPSIPGTQTAEVVGPAGSDIFTDKYGRVKVQFFWDREGKRDQDSSCWVRVSQVHAGRKWGGIDVPRTGEEVIVAFEDGDPDRPIVVGRVYNAREMPPFGLPKAGMVSGLKSNSTPGGGGSNEISLDDTKGKERMYVHAQYNQDEVVEHDQTSHVKVNRTKTVDADETTAIGKNRTEKVGIDHTETIGSNRKLTVGANETVSVGANQSVTVGGNHTNAVAANHTETVGSALSLTVGGMKTETVALASTETVGIAKTVSVGAAYALTVGASAAITVGGSQATNVGGGNSLSVGGAMTVTVAKALTETIGADAKETVAKKKVVDVGDELHLVCGDAKIVLKKDGTILIQGKDILLKGSGKITAKADGDVVLKGSKIGAN